MSVGQILVPIRNGKLVSYLGTHLGASWLKNGILVKKPVTKRKLKNNQITSHLT